MKARKILIAVFSPLFLLASCEKDSGIPEQFTDSQTGYIIGGDTTGGYLLKTVDAGQTWQLNNLDTPGKDRPTGMFFLNNTTGFISGKKLFRKTTDGGRT